MNKNNTVTIFIIDDAREEKDIEEDPQQNETEENSQEEQTAEETNKEVEQQNDEVKKEDAQETKQGYESDDSVSLETGYRKRSLGTFLSCSAQCSSLCFCYSSA